MIQLNCDSHCCRIFPRLSPAMSDTIFNKQSKVFVKYFREPERISKRLTQSWRVDRPMLSQVDDFLSKSKFSALRVRTPLPPISHTLNKFYFSFHFSLVTYFRPSANPLPPDYSTLRFYQNEIFIFFWFRRFLLTIFPSPRRSGSKNKLKIDF